MTNIHLKASVGEAAENEKEDVIAIQKALNEISGKIGLKTLLEEDGEIIGSNSESPTCKAIGLFQTSILGFRKPDYRIDAGGKSNRALSKECSGSSASKLNLFLPLIDPVKGLNDENFNQSAAILECEVAAVKAVSDVESAGSGFFDSGEPAILFEAHIFSKYSNRRFDESHPDISSRKWDRSLYVGGEKEYGRLQKAMGLDREAALKSASYGRYQIMGFNHEAAGYDDVETFVRDMFIAESNHLNAFVGFIKSNSRMHAAIQALDWATFARHYNGPAYAENHYDEKLQSAYDKFKA